LERGVPVWIVDTPANKVVAQRLWSERAQGSHLTGITTFDDMQSSAPADILIGQLDTIDLHHGTYSANPPYTIIEVLGALPTAEVKKELSAYGFNEFHTTAEGFIAERSRPSD
ncbi:MAG: hypothetical protein WAK91_09275, partial [Candidatus Acidiferrales bacterium]